MGSRHCAAIVTRLLTAGCQQRPRIIGCTANPSPEQPLSPSLAIEVAPFTLQSGVAETALFAASERLEAEFLRVADGYLGRALSQLPDGRWADILLWRSAEDAAAILPRVPESAACGAYFSCMVGANPDDAGHGVSIFRAMRTYGALANR